MRPTLALPVLAPAPDANTCFVVVRDEQTRGKLSEELRARGWSVVTYRSAVDLLAALADSILGHRAWDGIGLIVIEETSPGCRGSTIADGLRELGIAIPVVVIDRNERDTPPRTPARPLATAA